MSSDSPFSYRERLLIAPLIPGDKKQFLDARLESAMSLVEDGSSSNTNITPFPNDIQEILNQHNATEILVQVGTGSSNGFGHRPLDASALVEPWHTQGIIGSTPRRLDLGPSGVLVRATLRASSDAEGRALWEALLHDLVARRILLAPLFSVSIRRLHRHWISWKDDDNDSNNLQLQHYELVLPMEGSALSSEGMHAFATAFSPCHNQSGIFHWNSPEVLSEFFLKRSSPARHSWWIQMEQSEDDTAKSTTITRFTKGMQFQPHVDITLNRTVALTDIFPSSTRHRRCPFADETTLDTLVSSQVPLTLTTPSDEESASENNNYMYVNSRELTPNLWKEPWMTILPPKEATTAIHRHPPPKWSVHQTLQRPRGVAYSGRLMTQVVVRSAPQNENEDCQVSVDLQWFLPPIVQPTWSSFRVVWQDAQAQVERELDWRHDVQGSITAIDPTTGRSTQNTIAFDEGTLYFRIPQWNVTTSTRQEEHTLTISLDYRPAFLSFEHFPGDANRGVEIPPAVATFVEMCAPPASASSHPTTPIQLYSNSLLLLPPVPDMSMPFNVLSMTCSLYAFIIGSLLNLLIRKSSERVQSTYDPSKVPLPGKLKLLVLKLKEKVVALKAKLKGNKTTDKPSTADSAVVQDQSAEGNESEESPEADDVNSPDSKKTA